VSSSSLKELREEENTHEPTPPRNLFPAALQGEVAAREVLDAYDQQVGTAYPATRPTIRALSWWLAHGQTKEGLMVAVRNYAADMTQMQKPSRYRMGSARFFSRHKPEFEPYLKARAERIKPPPLPRSAEAPTPGPLMKSFCERLRRLA
jgi:hypothetical protein